MDYTVLKKNFENHRFHTSYFETKEEAAAYLDEQIKGETVGFGGCMTAKEMNLFEILKKKQRSDLALGTGTGCKDPGKKRIYRIHTERKCRCRDRSDHQY